MKCTGNPPPTSSSWLVASPHPLRASVHYTPQLIGIKAKQTQYMYLCCLTCCDKVQTSFSSVGGDLFLKILGDTQMHCAENYFIPAGTKCKGLHTKATGWVGVKIKTFTINDK